MMSIDNPWEDEMKEIIENGEPVYKYFWDSRAPGPGAETEMIYKYKGQYFVRRCDLDDLLGPYGFLVEAIHASELSSVTDAVVSITCTEIPTEELANKLTYLGDEGLKITINDEDWQVTSDGEFMRLSE